MGAAEVLSATWEHCSRIAQQKLTWSSPELWMTVLPVIFYWAVSAYF
jgi:hypothetical protein